MAADIIDSVGVALDAVEDRATFSGADIAPEAEGEEQ